MSNIWTVSDHHFNHDKDFIWMARGFSSVEEMNEILIERYNSKVKDEDTVYILGDCIMGQLEEGIKYLKRLKGKKYLAFGNHDIDNKIKEFAKENIFEDIQMGYRLKIKKRNIIATHYPTLVTNFKENRVINLFGHTHQTRRFYYDENDNINLNMYNVGVDCHCGFPVNLEDILKQIREEKELLNEKI